jgi:hypothetical protein
MHHVHDRAHARQHRRETKPQAKDANDTTATATTPQAHHPKHSNSKKKTTSSVSKKKVHKVTKKKLMIKCDVYANPLPGDDAMFWKLDSGDHIYVGSDDHRQIVLHDGRRTGGDHLQGGWQGDGWIP